MARSPVRPFGREYDTPLRFLFNIVRKCRDAGKDILIISAGWEMIAIGTGLATFLAGTKGGRDEKPQDVPEDDLHPDHDHAGASLPDETGERPDSFRGDPLLHRLVLRRGRLPVHGRRAHRRILPDGGTAFVR